MSTAFIQNSTKFFGHYQVVNGSEVIDCHNIGTAVSIRDRINNPEPVAPVAVEPMPNLELAGGCLTGGLGYTPAVTWLLTGRVEQVHNWATARTLKRDYPPCASLTSQA